MKYPAQWKDRKVVCSDEGAVSVAGDPVGQVVTHRVEGAASPGGMVTNQSFEAVPHGHAQGLVYRSKLDALRALVDGPDSCSEAGVSLSADARREEAFDRLDQAIEPLRREQGGATSHDAPRR